VKVATDKHRFDVVWKGSWYRLGSFSDHVKAKVPEGMALLLDDLYRERIVPMTEVHIPGHPI
jgi:hypothetical protein